MTLKKVKILKAHYSFTECYMTRHKNLNLDFFSIVTYRILYCCFDLGHGISPSGWYRLKPEGRGPLSSKGLCQGRNQNKSVMLLISYTSI